MMGGVVGLNYLLQDAGPNYFGQRNTDKSYRVLAGSLLTDKADAKAIRSLVEKRQLRGDDLVVLGALAARKAGGETWLDFRAKQPDLLGGQRLNGSVIVLVNRLASADPTILAMK